VSDVLFEKQNKIYKKITDRPSIIIGRRGSGKTAFLKSLLYGNEYKVAVEIKTYKAFSQIVRSVQSSIKQDGFVFAEDVAEYWEMLLWGAILSELSNKYPDIIGKHKFMSAFLERMKIRKGMAPQEVIHSIIRSIAAKAKNNTLAIAADVFVKLIDEDMSSIEDVKEQVQSILKEKNTKAVILLDSLDNYRLDVEAVKETLAGLLMCVGSFNVVKNRPEIRFCLPSELFHVFASLSENRVKDFSQKLVMHWHAGELLSIAAHRYKIYLDLYDGGDKDIVEFIGKLDVHDRGDAIRLFESIMPDYIKNKVGKLEKPIPYILRHTQLLPRHLLRYLTAIFKINEKMSTGDCTNIMPEAITEGVALLEGELWKEVCSAFSYKYPDAKAICKEIVPELPLAFSDGELHSKYIYHAKKYFKPKGLGYKEFKRMMIEIGCIGAVIDKSDIYINGIFEYTMPESLQPSLKNELCLHPMFCGGIKTEALSEGEVERVVYPYGADHEAKDYRDM
jgi:Cdc6-like AAA superfamily ATPase